MITFTKDLLELNPAYNDSIIQFESDVITGATKAVITVNSMQFVSVPINNKFTFNFKEIVKNIINNNRFEDTIQPNLFDAFYYVDDSILLHAEVQIVVHNLTANETVYKDYFFIRGVEQLPQYHRMSQINAPVRILLPSDNYMDYHVKMFEGYPFDIAVYGIENDQKFFFRNISSTAQTAEYTMEENGVIRFFLSDGATSVTDLESLIQPSTLNKLELWVDQEHRANININKVESDCGVYLKWLNDKGSYSYWKFDSVYKDLTNPKTIDDFEGYYDNLQNITSTSHLIGKTATRTIQIDTTFDKLDMPYLRDLVTSPAVWLYVHTSPFNQQQEYDFIGVKVNDSAFTLDNKKSKHKLGLTITLPEVNTITQ